MSRWLLLLIVLALLALSCLTVVQAPDWAAWQLGILAGEFGHWLAIAAFFAGLVSWWFRGDHPTLGAATLFLGVVSTVLFLKPAFQAWQIGTTLPEKLTTPFGPSGAAGEPFSLAKLFSGHDPAPVPVRTLLVAEGLPLDFYAPVKPGERGAPCVIVVHGGGWDSGDRSQIPQLNHWLARRGYAVAAISYRLAPKFVWPAQRDDVLAAIRFLKAHATELEINAERLVLLGRSAGGQIAQTVGYTAGDPAIRGVVGLYAPADLPFGYANTHENDMLKSPALMRQFLGGTPETARANFESASAIYQVGKQTPPTLLLHGKNDALTWYRHSVRLEARLKETGVPCAFVLLPWATHAFEFNLHGPGGQLTCFALDWFLASVTKEK